MTSRALICSGPNWNDEETVIDALDLINDIHEFSFVFWDEAESVSEFVDNWCEFQDVSKYSYPVNLESYELESPLSRSELIIRESRPDLVIAFRCENKKTKIERAALARNLYVLFVPGERKA